MTTSPDESPRAEQAKKPSAMSAFRYGRPAGRTIDRDSGPAGQNPGYALLGYLLSGMAAYGGLGWLIARWAGVPLLFPAGLVLGLGLGIWLVVIKYGRPGSG